MRSSLPSSPLHFIFQAWLLNSYFLQIIYTILAANKWPVYYLQLASARGLGLFLYRWVGALNDISKPFPRWGEILHLLLIEFPFKLRMLLSATRVPVKQDSFLQQKAANYRKEKKKCWEREGGKGEITKFNMKSSRIYACNKTSRS